LATNWQQHVRYFGALPIEVASGVDRDGQARGPRRFVMSRRGNACVGLGRVVSARQWPCYGILVLVPRSHELIFHLTCVRKEGKFASLGVSFS
jgi:hypothetical protein